MARRQNQLAIAHGAFNLVTGVWPLVSLGTFEKITGPKREGWLVKTTGTLIAGIGAALALAGARGRVTSEIATLAMATSAGLCAIDLYYAGLRRRISPVYLLDAAVELTLIGAWASTRASTEDAEVEVVRGVW